MLLVRAIVQGIAASACQPGGAGIRERANVTPRTPGDARVCPSSRSRPFRKPQCLGRLPGGRSAASPTAGDNGPLSQEISPAARSPGEHSRRPDRDTTGRSGNQDLLSRTGSGSRAGSRSWSPVADGRPTVIGLLNQVRTALVVGPSGPGCPVAPGCRLAVWWRLLPGARERGWAGGPRCCCSWRPPRAWPRAGWRTWPGPARSRTRPGWPRRRSGSATRCGPRPNPSSAAASAWT